MAKQPPTSPWSRKFCKHEIIQADLQAAGTHLSPSALLLHSSVCLIKVHTVTPHPGQIALLLHSNIQNGSTAIKQGGSATTCVLLPLHFYTRTRTFPLCTDTCPSLYPCLSACCMNEGNCSRRACTLSASASKLTGSACIPSVEAACCISGNWRCMSCCSSCERDAWLLLSLLLLLFVAVGVYGLLWANHADCHIACKQQAFVLTVSLQELAMILFTRRFATSPAHSEHSFQQRH